MEYASRTILDIATLSEIDNCTAAARKLREIAAWIDELEKRLEIRSAPNAKGETIYLGIGGKDGIGCRDETIKMLDNRWEQYEE